MTDETLKEKLTEVSSQDILDSLKTGATLYTNITESFVTEFVFYEKTLYEWAEFLSIKIPAPKDLDITSFRALLIDLSTNIQIASNYYSIAASMLEAIGGGNNIKKSDIINMIVSNYAAKGAKRPAATVIEHMADSYLTSTVSAEKAAKIVKNFWKQRLDTLLDLRKVFEQIGMSISVEMKFTAQ
jgi:hypothetical protein